MKRDLLSSPWVDIVGAVAGGVAFGFGVGTIVRGVTPVGVLLLLAGLILLWWSLVNRRKYRPGTPESETGGDRTIE